MFKKYDNHTVCYSYKDCVEQAKHKKIMVNMGYSFTDNFNCTTTYKKRMDNK